LLASFLDFDRSGLWPSVLLVTPKCCSHFGQPAGFRCDF